jgi:hypothetical protein
MRPRGRQVTFLRSSPTEKVIRGIFQFRLSLSEVMNYEMTLSIKNLLHYVRQTPVYLKHSLSFAILEAILQLYYRYIKVHISSLS